MRVGILTIYYKNLNYGGILQAFALQKAIENLGHEAKQITFDYTKKINKYSAIDYLKRTVKKTLSLMPGYYHELAIRSNNFEKFANKIPHTNIVTKDNISNVSNDFDVFVCGSDQIWNPIGWQPTFFFDFLPKSKKRISYAASIARNNLSNDELKYIENYIFDFSAVSVREDISASILNSYFNDINVQVMPDPTLLLDIKEWNELITNTHPLIKGKYIIAYFLGTNNEIKNKCIEYAKNNKIPIYFISSGIASNKEWESKHKKIIINADVENFLYLIKNSTMVLTDSYHGVIFSSIFLKNYYVFKRFKDNENISMNSRIYTVTEMLGTSRRIIKDINDINDCELSSNEVDNITHSIITLQNKGIRYLKENIK